MGAIFIEEFVLGLLNLNVSAWALLIMFQGTCMYLANKLGKRLFKG